MRVLLTDFVFEDRDRIQLDGCTFKIHEPTKSPEELIELARDVDIICVRDQFVNVSRKTIERLQGMKMIATRSTGYDHVGLKPASEKEIVACNIPRYGAHRTAEHAFGLLLAVGRNAA